MKRGSLIYVHAVCNRHREDRILHAHDEGTNEGRASGGEVKQLLGQGWLNAARMVADVDVPDITRPTHILVTLRRHVVTRALPEASRGHPEALACGVRASEHVVGGVPERWVSWAFKFIIDQCGSGWNRCSSGIGGGSGLGKLVVNTVPARAPLILPSAEPP